VTNEEITALVGRLVQLQISTQEQIKELGQHIDVYVTASNARMERMEANLDTLIRAITAEHSNGKTKH
jgi:hypothetical protein